MCDVTEWDVRKQGLKWQGFFFFFGRCFLTSGYFHCGFKSSDQFLIVFILGGKISYHT